MTAFRLGRLLVVDDEPELMSGLCQVLNEQGYEAVGFASADEAVRALKEQEFDVLVTDLKMPQMDGMELLKRGLEADPNLVGIIITGHGSIQSAVEAMKLGAFDFILKPFKVRSLLPVIARAVEVRRLKLENMKLRETVAVYELSKAMSFTLDLGTILNKLADAGLQQFEADELSIMLPTEEGNQLRVAVVRGPERGHLVGERASLENGIAGWVARHGETVTLQGSVKDPRFSPVYPRPEIRSAVCHPLMAGGKIVGVLSINSLSRHRRFSLGEVKSLSLLCNTAAAALGNASLYGEVLQAERKYRSIFENAVEGIYQTAPDGRLLAANPALARILGYDSPEELMEACPDVQRSYMEPGRREEFQRRMAEGGEVRDFEYRVRRKDGTPVWIRENARAVRDADGGSLRYEGMMEDVTGRKRAEDALWRSEEKFSKAFRASPDWIVIATLEEGRALEVNEAFLKGSGFSKEELIGRTSDEVGLWVDPGERVRLMGIIRETGSLRDREVEFRIKSGEVRTVLWSGEVMEIGGEACLITVSHDITDRKRLETQLVQAQKMEAIGRLVGGIAHDFNNLITAVLGYSELALMSIPEGERFRDDVQEIRKAGEKASALVAQLMAFSRRQVIEPLVLDLTHVVTDMEPMLRRIIGEDIQLASAAASALWPVRVDLSQMEQVIMNLVVNARDAMPEGGKLTLEVANVELDETYARTHLHIAPGPHVMLAVSDTGTGMDAATRARIFEPFFTTKEAGKGTGLGLATVYGIVRQSGGSVWVYSEVGQGTTFKIYLPAVQDGLGAETGGAGSSPTLVGTETVLVVEDEEAVRVLAANVLRTFGYEVVTAQGGEDALQICRDHPSPIHVLLTDVVMPGMSGRDLALKAKEIRPSIQTVFMSGYPENAIVRNGALKGDSVYLQKPFTPDGLARKIREAMDG